LRNILGSFLFSGEDVDKKVMVLSGGEKTRLALAKMLLQPINFLVLDEPTNHLDMAAKDVLKNALLHFNGTLIVVSHDRDFLSGLTTRIFEFRDHQIRQLNYDIHELMEIRDQEQAAALKIQRSQAGDREISASKQQYLDNKEKDRQKRKIERQISEAETTISEIESAMLIIENQLNSPEQISNSQDYSHLATQYTNLKKQLEQIMAEWESLIGQLENI